MTTSRRGEGRALRVSFFTLAVLTAVVNWKLVPDEPPRGTTYYNLGVALSMEGRRDEANVFYEKALAVRPENHVARFALANSLCVLGRRDEAVAHYREVLKAMPENAYAHNNLSVALDECGRHDEAALHLRRALQLEPSLATRPGGTGNAGATTPSRGARP